jgi:hypothetical protein
MSTNGPDPAHRARRRTEDVWAFFLHVGLFVAINGWIWMVDLTNGDGIEFAYWITIPWAILLVLHGLTVRAETRLFGETWRESRFEEYLERETRPRP